MVPCQMPLVIIVLHYFNYYWHFENDVAEVIAAVLLHPDGLPHVLALAVPLLMFLPIRFYCKPQSQLDLYLIGLNWIWDWDWD